jgi:glycosyltransferase involved in cell wall biosynthesis
MRRVLEGPSAKLAISRFCRQVLLDAGVAAEGCAVLPLGYSPEVDRVDDSLYLPARGAIKLLAVTNAHDLNRYGTDLLLQAFTRAVTPTDDVSLILRDYGAYSPDLAGQIERLREAGYDAVYFARFLSKEDMVRFYRACDVFVAPFRGEGFGVKILDAMACGLPVVAPLYGGPADFLHEGNCLPVHFKEVPVGDCLDRRSLQLSNSPTWCEVDVDDLAHQLAAACADLEGARRRARRGQSEVHECFSWQSIARRLVDLVTLPGAGETLRPLAFLGKR